VVLSTAGFKRPGSWETLRALFEAPYREGFRIETPNVKLDRAVPFNRFLIDLGFNGYLHVCELFDGATSGRVTSGQALRLAQ